MHMLSKMYFSNAGKPNPKPITCNQTMCRIFVISLKNDVMERQNEVQERR